MRVLLDENLPHQLRRFFVDDIEVVTVSYRGWKGKENGELLTIAAREFDALENRKEEITKKFESNLEWQRNADKQETFIIVSRDGSIESSDEELDEIREWYITNLLKLKEVFQPEIERALETLSSIEQEDSV